MWSYRGRVARVLITGMSGTGRTTVLEELRRRGHRTLDTDYDGWVLADGWLDARLPVTELADALERL
jgi:predicted ATPase